MHEADIPASDALSLPRSRYHVLFCSKIFAAYDYHFNDTHKYILIKNKAASIGERRTRRSLKSSPASERGENYKFGA